ncbi:MAG: hypothetical protein ACP5O1_11530 [Phycisphaerae bacterium]
MQAWITGIIGQINNADLAAAMGAAPAAYLDRAPESVAPPLVVIAAKKSVVTHDLAMNQYIQADAEIAIYATQLSAAQAGADATITALDGVNFAVQGATLLSNRITESPAATISLFNSAAEPVYKVALRVGAILFVLK